MVIKGYCTLAKKFGGHDVRSQPEEGDEGGDAGELVPGREQRITGLLLDNAQFDALVGEHASRVFFNGSPDRPLQRAFQSFSRIKLDDKYKNCTVLLRFGVENCEVRIEAATLKNLAVEFTKMDRAQLCCTYVGTRPRTLEALDLEDYAGEQIYVELYFGSMEQRTGEQPQLPLEQAPVDKTRIVGSAEQEQQNAETERQLGEALRGLESQDQQSAA